MDQPSLFMMGAAGAKTTEADKDKKKDMTAIADNRISDIQINQDKKRILITRGTTTLSTLGNRKEMKWFRKGDKLEIKIQHSWSPLLMLLVDHNKLMKT